MDLPIPQDLKKMTTKDLQTELEQARRKAHTLQIGIRTQQNKNSHEYRLQKKFIAQILTELNNRQEKL